MIFLKKTSVIAINLKPARLFILLPAFLSVIFLSVFLSSHLPAISLSDDFTRIILSSNTAYKRIPLSSVGAFALAEKSPPPLESEVTKKEAISSTQKISTPQKANPNAEVKINNSTDKSINPQDYLAKTPAFLKEDFSVLIVHTHTTESYTPSEKFNYTPTDTDRTTDKKFNMVAVGKEIKDILTQQGIKVYHDTTINDYPSYSGSYNKSAIAIENFIKNDPSIKMVLDIHRDAIVDKNGEKVKYVTEVGGNSTAKIMFVVGSDLNGLKHDNWAENMSFATQLQKHILSMYPDLCRPINFRKQRFNQQLAPGGIIVEIGTNANTLDEAISGARYFAVSLADFIKSQK